MPPGNHFARRPRKKYEQAQLFADDAVRLGTNNPVARYCMATVFTYQGRYAEALEQSTNAAGS